MKIALIGSGVYAMAISNIIDKKNNIYMWTERNDYKDIITSKNMIISNSYEEVVRNADLIFILVAAKYVKSCIQNMKEYIASKAIIIIGSKGLDEYGNPLSMTVNKIISNNIAILSGPTFANDISSGYKVGFTLACHNKKNFALIKDSLNNVFLEYSPDIKSVEMAGSLKNVYAIGSGIISGLSDCYSTLCLYITKVLKEIEYIFIKQGFSKESLLTLACVGDLILTCTSTQSRNNTFGKIVAQNNSSDIEEFKNSKTVEGYENTKSFYHIFKSLNLDTPILNTIYDIIILGNKPESLIETLLK